MLRLAQSLMPRWREVALTTLDRHDLVTAETRAGFKALGWDLTVLRGDVHDWVADRNPAHFDLCVTCLFLHHFEANTLSGVMRAIASKADAFVACEPQRNVWSRTGSRLIGMLATNSVTQEDALKSVDAGFADDELTALWPQREAVWSCKEYSALPFTHCLTAARNRPRDE
jgi:hypothetical protein